MSIVIVYILPKQETEPSLMRTIVFLLCIGIISRETYMYFKGLFKRI